MSKVAAATEDCIYREVPGSCELADELYAESVAAGICWEPETNPYYCNSSPTPEIDAGFPYDYSRVRQQFQQLPETERRELQTALAEAEHYSGAIDGLFGPGTSNAIIAALQSQGAEIIEVLDMATPDTIMSAFRRVLTVSSAEPQAPAPPPVAVTPSPPEGPEYPFVGNWRCVEHSDESEMPVRLSAESISLPEMGLTVDYSEVNSIGGRDTAFHVRLRDGQEAALVEVQKAGMVMISPLGIYSCDKI
ncbi:peptidoglycan-binding protein [Roseibaca sp. V10]|uniref:Peptidoglycan-binding protein n=1 Tax=Roseinatronobacter domitianus TaxID=2940293 RepID=A0ABT0M5H7_9RHOB|nr:peptidoglycan-binding domain-containing protein [Roseibaca domitiana]MCL1630116.1 peptidoglycan-binding protein [Roseibaca domitiana]